LTSLDKNGAALPVPGNAFCGTDIPLRASGPVAWEYVPPEPPAENSPNTYVPPAPKKHAPPPIVKIEYQSGPEEIAVRGKIMEIVENIDPAAYFQINTDNPIAASLIKELLNRPLLQITVHAGLKNGQTGSYNILIDRPLFKRHRLAKGAAVSLTLKAKTVNGRRAWCCTGVSAQ
jgi:hypothetical protein